MNEYFVAFLLTLIFVLALKRAAASINLVDRPQARKQHTGEVPLIGGIAIYTGFMISLVIAHVSVVSLVPFTIASAFLVIVGIWDDRHGLSPRVRLLLQTTAALYLMLVGDVVVRDLGSLTMAQGPFDLRFMIYPFTILAVVGIINAFNLSDGLDGLAGGLTLVPLLAIAIITFGTAEYDYTQASLLLASAVAGFLLFNLRTPWRREASIFLGSAGSTFLGFALSWLLIDLSQGRQRVIEPAAVPWFLAVPFLDMVFVMSRRMLKGQSPFKPDREHFHHVLLLAGYSVKQSVMILTALSALCIVIGQWGALFVAHDGLVIAAFVAFGCAYFLILSTTWRHMRFMGRSICRRQGAWDRRAIEWGSAPGETTGNLRFTRDRLDRRSGEDRRRDRRGLPVSHSVPDSI